MLLVNRMKWLCRMGGGLCFLVALPLFPVLTEWGFVFLLLSGAWGWAAREAGRVYETDPER